MQSEATAESRAARNNLIGAPPPHSVEQKPLPCPRCESSNTKFCYYNNYNLSQPRHFCKSCRRYWTHGGTLRDIPIGGASRKSAKRSRTSSPASFLVGPAQPVPATAVANPVAAVARNSFTSLLSTAGPGILALGGLVLGFQDVGFGLGQEVWAFPEGGHVSGGMEIGVDGGGDGNVNRGESWQVDAGDGSGFGGVISGDGFTSFPELAVYTEGNGLK